MTADKHTKQAARALAAREGTSYTAARRRLTSSPQDGPEQPQRSPEPPLAYLTANSPCPEDCDGAPHPQAVCWVWQPKDAKGARWEVRHAADLPRGRAAEVMHWYEPPLPSNYHAREADWLLALVYAMLTDQHPELRPDRAALRAAVEADGMSGVDAVMEPLDRAAARLLTKQPDQWWGEVKPRLDAYADTVDHDDRDLRTWQEIEGRDRVQRLVDQWRRAWTKTRNSGGYYDAPGVMWLAPKEWLDALLVDRHGGHGPGARVCLADGRPAVVYAAEWAEAGPPAAYRVRELVPGTHGNVGRLVPSLSSDVLVAAGDCRNL